MLQPPTIEGHLVNLDQSHEYNKRKLYNTFLEKELEEYSWLRWDFLIDGSFILITLLSLIVSIMSFTNNLSRGFESLGVIAIIFMCISLPITFRQPLAKVFFLSPKIYSHQAFLDLESFFNDHWLEIELYPYETKIYYKIQETKKITQQLYEQHQSVRLFSQAPNINKNLQEKVKIQVQQLQQNLDLYQSIFNLYQAFEQEMFALKKHWQSQQVIQASQQQLYSLQGKVTEPFTQDNNLYIQRLKEFESIHKKIPEVDIDSQSPLQAQQVYDQLYQQLTQKN